MRSGGGVSGPDDAAAGSGSRGSSPPSSRSRSESSRTVWVELGRLVVPSGGIVYLAVARSDVPWWAPFLALVFLAVPASRDAIATIFRR